MGLDGSDVGLLRAAGLGGSNGGSRWSWVFLHIGVCFTDIWPILLGGEAGEVISNLIKTLRLKTNKKLIVLVSPWKVNRIYNEALLRREADFTLSSSVRKPGGN